MEVLAREEKIIQDRKIYIKRRKKYDVTTAVNNNTHCDRAENKRMKMISRKRKRTNDEKHIFMKR